MSTPTSRAQPDDILKLPYERRVLPDASGGFSASMPEFPGCCAQGESEVEARQNLERAAWSWLMAAIEQDLLIPPPQDNRKQRSDQSRLY